MPQQNEPKHLSKPGAGGGKRKNIKLRLALLIILAVIMALIAVICVLYRVWVVKPELNTPDPLDSAGVIATDDPSVSFDPVEPKITGERKSEDFYTILVFGEDETSGLTDTMMVVSYDVTNQNATVMSIPRDLLINSSGRSVASKQINAVYSRGGKGEAGIAALKNEVSELIGFVPDYYVKINWELVGQMVDAIGGVWFDIPYHMDYDDPYQDLYIHYDKGYQYLTGEDAMNVVRWRKNNAWSPYANEGGGSDTGRVQVQQAFLAAVLDQALQLKNVTRIGQLAELFGENVVSDLAIENFFWFGSQAIFGGLKVSDVNFCTIPYYGVSAADSVYLYRVYPNEAALLELINSSLNPYVEDVTIRQLDLIRVSADGNTLSSSTGVLADPSAAIPPATPEPTPSVTPSAEPTPSLEPSAEPEPSVGPEPSANPEPTESAQPSEQPVSTEPMPTAPPPGTQESEPADSGFYVPSLIP